MARLAVPLLAFAQLTLIHCHPAPEIVLDRQALYDRDILTLSSIKPTTSYSSAITSLQSASISVLPSITGSIQTALPSGGITDDPLKPGGTATGTELSPAESGLSAGPTQALSAVSSNIFQPIATGLPPQAIPTRDGHYVKKQHIVDGDVPIQTNKFYANFFLGGQGNPVWTHPYHLAWSKGGGQTRSYGMAISHTERSQFAYGPDASNPQYFLSPLGIDHMVLSAAELGQNTVLSVEELKAFSVYANLAPNATSPAIMSLPCVQGMGFITAIYNAAKPVINSGVFFRTFDLDKTFNNGVTFKWRITLNDGTQWLLYVTPVGSKGVPPFTLDDSATISGPQGFKGMIQVAKNPGGTSGEQSFDAAAGAYATNATITGSTSGQTGSYTLAWGKGGIQTQTLLMYALPHHVESFDSNTKQALKDIRLVTTTKGFAQAVLADKITMVENDLPSTMGFAPWAKNPNGAGGSGNVNLQAGALALVIAAGRSELAQDFVQQTKLNSMYYSGKGLAKFAGVIYTMNTIAGSSQIAAAGLIKLKDAFNVFVNNTQPEPLVYDTVWKGVVSSATYKPINGGPGDPGLDFGNTLYNDHHFHYGYFVYTAAVIAHLDSKWLDEGTNKAYVNSLLRDFANPVDDKEYPFQRSFDWFHGHSWAKGLFESGDGKDQESTSEDTFATYAIKMWGKTIGDANMEARGNLQLAVQARSIKNYFLLESNNQNQPPLFLHNKNTGILFENKIDHTTYFGSNIEYIQGIHMIPLNPSSAYTRRIAYVKEEWDTYFSSGRVDKVQGGWKAILYANLALIDPQTAYNFFADPNFNTQLDGGASRTWYLAYTASLLNAGNAKAEPDLKLKNSNAGGAKAKETEGAEAKRTAVARERATEIKADSARSATSQSRSRPEEPQPQHAQEDSEHGDDEHRPSQSRPKDKGQPDRDHPDSQAGEDSTHGSWRHGHDNANTPHGEVPNEKAKNKPESQGQPTERWQVEQDGPGSPDMRWALQDKPAR